MGSGRAAAWVAAALSASLAASPGPAQEEPVGPCSPYRAADGDIPSEMPGCASRSRPVPGSLADELEFRRGRKQAEAEEAAAPEDDARPPIRRRARARRP